MELLRYVILCSVFFHCNSVAFGNPFKSKNYTQAQGLTSNTITQIFQDHYGFVWLGTPDGLNRFDGIEFNCFTHNPTDSTSISNNEIQFIFEDQHNDLWVGTRYGLSQFNRLTETFRNIYFNKNQKDSSLFDVTYQRTNNLRFYAYFAPHDSSVWLSSDYSELIHYKINSRQAKRYRPYENTSASVITGHSPGKLWIGTANRGLLLYDYQNQRITRSYLANNQDSKQKAQHILSIEPYGETSYLVGTNGGGLYIYKSQSDEFERIIIPNSTESSKISTFISSIIHLKDHKYLLGTDGAGIQTIDIKNRKLIETTHSKSINTFISNPIIRCLFIDRDKNLWAGNYHGGVNVIDYFTNNQIVHIKPRRDEIIYTGANMVNSLMRDTRGKLWVGTDAGTILIYNSDYSLHRTIDGPKPSSGEKNAILSLYQDSQGQIWVGTFLLGLSRLDTVRQSFQSYSSNTFDEGSIPHNDVRAIIEDSQKRLWVGTNGGGIGILDKTTHSFQTISQFKNSADSSLRIYCDNVTSFYKDKQENIWISTINGLYVYVDKTGVIHFFDSDIPENSLYGKKINAILQENESDFLIGSSVGLFRLRMPNGPGEKFYLESPQNKLSNTNIKSMLSDETGNLWLGHNKGITRLDKKSQTVHLFNQQHGFQLEGYNVNAALTLASGELCFGGVNGFNVFSPHQIRLDSSVAEVILTNIEVGGKELAKIEEKLKTKNLRSIHELEKIILSSKDYILKLEFVAPNYRYPENLNYTYRLDGFDQPEQWTEVNATQRSVTYTNLNPGEYNFIIKASNNNVWSSKTTSLNIIVTPPFWKTNIFYFMFVLVIVASLLWLRNSVLKIERQRVLKNKIDHENQINEQKFKFFTNISHEIRTPLTLIIEPLKKILGSEEYQYQNNVNKPLSQNEENLRLIYKNAIRLHRIVDQLMDFRKMEAGVMPLNIAENDLVGFIKETCNLFSLLVDQKKSSLIFQTTHNKLLMPFDFDKLEKVLLNLLSNAFKFSFPEAKVVVKLDVIITETEQQFASITVRDNGIGIPRNEIENIFERFYQVKHDNYFHHGSGVGLSFVKEIMELLKGKIEVRSDVGKGTDFTILLPLGDHEYEKAKTVRNHTIYNTLSQNDLAESEKDSNQIKKTHSDKYSILLVEDNDDIRRLIYQALESDFNIETAKDGREGVIMAKKNYPNLIISDIMMPYLDGYELCKELKKDVNTCHIPIILLSAKSSDESVIEGYETGADEYIPKPFSSGVLKTRVNNLIKNRTILRDRFLKEIDILPGDFTNIKRDERLLNKFIQIVEQNCHRSDFNADKFGQMAGMSRSVLYSKVKEITGQTVADFIKIIRLKMAAKLLRRKEYSVQEISEKTGYKYLSHFSRSFSEYFGVSPSKFIEMTEFNEERSI